jgi:integrase
MARVSTTKTGEERRARTVRVLEDHRARLREERMKARVWEDPGLVFANTRGGIRRRDSVVEAFRRLLAEAGLPSDVHFHDLRHTACTLGLRQGSPCTPCPRCSVTPTRP